MPGSAWGSGVSKPYFSNVQSSPRSVSAQVENLLCFLLRSMCFPGKWTQQCTVFSETARCSTHFWPTSPSEVTFKMVLRTSRVCSRSIDPIDAFFADVKVARFSHGFWTDKCGRSSEPSSYAPRVATGSRPYYFGFCSAFFLGSCGRPPCSPREHRGGQWEHRGSTTGASRSTVGPTGAPRGHHGNAAGAPRGPIGSVQNSKVDSEVCVAFGSRPQVFDPA